MLQKLYSTLLRIAKGWFLPTPLETPELAKHWLNVEIGKCKQFLPLSPEAELEIARIGVGQQQEVLDGIHKRLSILEEKTLGKSYPSDTELRQPRVSPNVIYTTKMSYNLIGFVA